MQGQQFNRFFVAWIIFNFILTLSIWRTDHDFWLKLLWAVWLSALLAIGFVYEQYRIERENRIV